MLTSNTPISMIWKVKNLEILGLMQHPIPNNKKFPYINRLFKLADDVSPRRIKLYYDSNGLSSSQIEQMTDLANKNKSGRENIEVIDYNARFKGKHDLSFLEDKDLPFACKIDIMRIIPLLEDAPTIYFDFDITIRNDKKFEEVELNKHGFAMGKTMLKDQSENSVIAVNQPNNFILKELYSAITHFFKNDKKALYNNPSINDTIWAMQWFAIKQMYVADKEGHCFQDGELSSKIIDYHSTNTPYPEIQNQEWRKLKGVSDFMQHMLLCSKLLLPLAKIIVGIWIIFTQ